MVPCLCQVLQCIFASVHLVSQLIQVLHIVYDLLLETINRLSHQVILSVIMCVLQLLEGPLFGHQIKVASGP